jgi:hypothetical protein
VDHANPTLGNHGLTAKDFIWQQDANGSMIAHPKREATPCSLNRAAASLKLNQNYLLTQFSLQTQKSELSRRT